MITLSELHDTYTAWFREQLYPNKGHWVMSQAMFDHVKFRLACTCGSRELDEKLHLKSCISSGNESITNGEPHKLLGLPILIDDTVQQPHIVVGFIEYIDSLLAKAHIARQNSNSDSEEKEETTTKEAKETRITVRTPRFAIKDTVSESTFYLDGPALVYLGVNADGVCVVYRMDSPMWGTELDARDRAIMEGLRGIGKL